MQDLLVMYRQTQPTPGKLVKLRQRIVGPNEQESTPKYQQRNSINMRIYRDIPVPSWKIVFPNKLLQFRPLDGLRSDLVSIAGLLCTCTSYPPPSPALPPPSSLPCIGLGQREAHAINHELPSHHAKQRSLDFFSLLSYMYQLLCVCLSPVVRPCLS